MLLVAGGAAAASRRDVGRRAVVQAALAAVGGLALSACGNQASPCTPLVCDPGDGGFDDGGLPDGRVSAEGGARDGGSGHHRDGGVGRGGGGAPVPCPPSGYVCAEDNGATYADIGGGVG